MQKSHFIAALPLNLLASTIAFAQTAPTNPQAAPPSEPASPAPADSSALPSVDSIPSGTSDTASTPAEAAKPAASTTEAAKPRNRFVEEIVVTAQKREENLQSVPISVQAFSGDMLDARGITNQNGLQQITPSLDIGNQIGYTTIFLRGVGSDAFLTADPSVAYYVDGVYFPFAQGLIQDFGALQRIEVLKGPQGTLFGRNAVGGAINVITKAPSFAGPELSVQSSYGNFRHGEARVYANIPVTDTVAFSASIIDDTAENYYRGSTAAGHSLPTEDTKGARLKVRWAPTDSLEFNLAAMRLQTTGVGSIYQLNANPSTLGTLIGIQPQPGYTGSLDSNSFTHVENTVYYGSATYKLPFADLKLMGSHQKMDTQGLFDFDGSNLPLVSFGPNGPGSDQYAHIQTAEVQLVSSPDGWASSWLKWIAGGYYFRGEQGFYHLELTLAGIDPRNGTIAGIPVPTGLFTELNTLAGDLGITSLPSGQISLNGIVGTLSKSGYFQGTITFTDWLALTLGGRYQVETRKIVDSSVALETTNGATSPFINFTTAHDQNGNTVPTVSTTSSFRPKVSIDTHPFQDDTLVYASYQKAIKSGTFNAVAIYLPPSYVKPEEMTAYEVGIKTSLFDSSLRVDAAAFQYNIKNLQTQFVSLLEGGAISFENAPGARSRGAEVGWTAQIVPNWIDNLVFAGGAAYLDSTYTSYPNGTGYDQNNGLFSQGNDYTGHRIVRSPRWSGNLSLSKTWNISDHSLELSADAYINSGFYYSAANTPRTKQSKYQVYNARASYMYEPWQLRVTVFGQNLLNKVYTAGEQETDFGNLITLAPPRMYGVRLNWDWGGNN